MEAFLVLSRERGNDTHKPSLWFPLRDPGFILSFPTEHQQEAVYMVRFLKPAFVLGSGDVKFEHWTPPFLRGVGGAVSDCPVRHEDCNVAFVSTLLWKMVSVRV